MSYLHFTDEQQRTGALECIEALKALEHSAENMLIEGDEGAIFAAIQSGDAEKLADEFGPMTPQGAFRAMAEYIHHCLSSGTPALTQWKPFVAKTPEEVELWVKSLEEDEVAA